MGTAPAERTSGDGRNPSTSLQEQWFFNSVVTSDEMCLEVLDSGQTVTADIYKDQLSRVDQALRRQGVETTSTKFLHDNARQHVAKTTLEKIEELGWEVLSHPPYSPDLAPSDYHLFRSMLHSLAERKFKNREEVQLWVSNYFDSQPAEFFKRGIYSLRTHWQQVIDSNGEYFLD
ncbi:hypothetical protein V3C99_010631 [Haemonchus contortus]